MCLLGPLEDGGVIVPHAALVANADGNGLEDDVSVLADADYLAVENLLIDMAVAVFARVIIHVRYVCCLTSYTVIISTERSI